MWLCLAFILAVAGLRAQELSFLAGGGSMPNLRSSSYSWDLGYRQHLFRHLSGSVSWINEGHLEGHHRDGTAAQVWVDLPLFKGRYIFSAGAGGYYYFDTQATPAGNTVDVHDTAAIVSFSATAYFTDRWFARLLLNRINPRDDFRSNTLLLGAGYWFGQDKRPTPGAMGGTPEEAAYVTGNELTLFTGTSVVNAAFSEHGQAYAVEYRHGLMSHLDGTVSFTYEGDPKIVRRSGVGLQVWPVNTFFHEHVTVGIGLGAYVYIDNKHLGSQRQVASGVSVSTPAIAPLISPTFAVRVAEDWVVRLVWDRVITNYNRDSDVFLIGAGYRWK